MASNYIVVGSFQMNVNSWAMIKIYEKLVTLLHYLFIGTLKVEAFCFVGLVFSVLSNGCIFTEFCGLVEV